MIDQKRSLTPSAPQDALFDAIELFHFAFRAFTALPDEILAQRGLGRLHHRVMYFVARRPGQRVSDLLATLGISKQALHTPLKQLVDDGLVELQADASDRRVRRLVLTPVGAELEARLSAAQRGLLANVFAAQGPAAEAAWRAVMADLAGSVRGDVDGT